MAEYNDQNHRDPLDAPDNKRPEPEHTAGDAEKSADTGRPYSQPGSQGSQGSYSDPLGRPRQGSAGGYRQSLGQDGRRAPYSPSYPDNHYPPRRPGGQNDYGRPYQYNANDGWQPPPKPSRQNDSYEWKFEDYEQHDPKERKKGGGGFGGDGRPPKKNRGLMVFTVLLVCVLSVGLIGVAGYSIYMASSDGWGEGRPEISGEAESDALIPPGELQIVERPADTETTTVDGKLTIPQVAEVVLPSVVGVIKYDNDQYFEISGYGSGIVMSEDGYIITNAHVVEGGTGFKVQFVDGEAYDATVIGSDRVTDLAVLHIDATGLSPAQFGDSTNLRVGETVVAVGNPASMELAGSVTSGIISAVNREVRTINFNMVYIQTDAAINPGNSGGALANEYGQVIGINSSKIIAEGYEGIGFAIPISTAKPIIDDIIANGRVTGRVMLGITCRAVDEIDARNYDIQMGIMIDEIDPESDLHTAGVLRGDIITHLAGERVYDLNDVQTILGKHKPGDTVTLTIYRRIGTKEQTFEVETRLLESR